MSCDSGIMTHEVALATLKPTLKSLSALVLKPKLKQMSSRYLALDPAKRVFLPPSSNIH